MYIVHIIKYEVHHYCVIISILFNSLCNSVIIHNLRAIGLFSKAVTGPWMRLVARKDLKLTPFLNQAVTLLQKWANDARPMLRPISLFGQDVRGVGRKSTVSFSIFGFIRLSSL